MTKREIAVASVESKLDGRVPFDALRQLTVDIVDGLIRDGIINLGYAGTPEISMVVDAFQINFGNTATVRTDRFAAQRLIKRHGEQQVLEAIAALATRKAEKFAPWVNNLTQFEQKWPSITTFIKTKTTSDFDV